MSAKLQNEAEFSMYVHHGSWLLAIGPDDVGANGKIVLTRLRMYVWHVEIVYRNTPPLQAFIYWVTATFQC